MDDLNTGLAIGWLIWYSSGVVGSHIVCKAYARYWGGPRHYPHEIMLWSAAVSIFMGPLQALVNYMGASPYLKFKE